MVVYLHEPKTFRGLGCKDAVLASFQERATKLTLRILDSEAFELELLRTYVEPKKILSEGGSVWEVTLQPGDAVTLLRKLWDDHLAGGYQNPNSPHYFIALTLVQEILGKFELHLM